SARLEIQEALSGTSATTAPPVAIAHVKSWNRLAWSLVAALGVVSITALAVGALAYFGRAPQQLKAVRFVVSPPEGWNLREAGAGPSAASLTVSPDGQRVAFVARGADGKSLLWIRALDRLAAQSLAGTDDALSPFWSPDSRFLGFFAGGKLKK